MSFLKSKNKFTINQLSETIIFISFTIKQNNKTTRMFNKNKINPWAWVPSLYFAQGLPYVIVITVSTIIYKNIGLSNADITFLHRMALSSLVIKPFWSPFIDNFRTKRFGLLLLKF
jgi:uncharacterized membrane protein YdcZ (DUF606 family)